MQTRQLQKTSGSLYQYCRDKPALDNTGAIADFTNDNTTDLFKPKEKTTSQAGKDDTKRVEIVAPLKYISHFWETLEIPHIYCEVNLYKDIN